MTQLGEHDFVEERHFHHPAYRRLRNLRNNLVLVDLLENQRHGQHASRLDFGKSLEQHFRRRSFTNEIRVTTCAEVTEEVKCAAERVCERQEDDVATTFVRDIGFTAELHVTCECIKRRYDTFRETGSTGSINERSKVFVGLVGIFDVLFLEALRVTTFELFPHGANRDLVMVDFVDLCQRLVVIEGEDSHHLLHLVDIHILIQRIGDEEELGLRVVDDMYRVIGAEVLQNRHNNSAISHSCQISGCPAAGVFSHKGNTVILFDTTRAEKNM